MGVKWSRSSSPQGRGSGYFEPWVTIQLRELESFLNGYAVTLDDNQDVTFPNDVSITDDLIVGDNVGISGNLTVTGTIFGKGTLLAAGSAQASAQSLTTTETKFLEQTIACDGANQQVWVYVAGWVRSNDVTAGEYLWLRVGVNGSPQGSLVPLVDASGSTDHTLINASRWVVSTADGAGDLKVSLHSRIEVTAATADVMDITYAVFRRNTV